MNAPSPALLPWLLIFVFARASHCQSPAQTAPEQEAQRAKTPSKVDEQAAARKIRLEWNLRTLVDPYERSGRRSAKWDNSAKLGLSSFAQIRANGSQGDADESLFKLVRINCEIAVAAGCDDPMVAYLHARNVLADRGVTPQELGNALRKSADALNASEYPSIRKFYAALRAAEQLNIGMGTNTSVEVQRLRRMAVTNLVSAL